MLTYINEVKKGARVLTYINCTGPVKRYVDAYTCTDTYALNVPLVSIQIPIVWTLQASRDAVRRLCGTRTDRSSA